MVIWRPNQIRRDSQVRSRLTQNLHQGVQRVVRQLNLVLRKIQLQSLLEAPIHQQVRRQVQDQAKRGSLQNKQNLYGMK